MVLENRSDGVSEHVRHLRRPAATGQRIIIIMIPNRHQLNLPATAILVTGPARSGKSEWAERLASTSGRAVIYVATALENPEDADWTARIAAHRQRRPAHWQTLAVPDALEAALAAHSDASCCLLVDSLGTWVANLLERDDTAWQIRRDALLEQIDRSAALVICVGEETGWGVIPAYPDGRTFRDRLGGLIRHLGSRCAASWLVTGGYALDLARYGIPLESGVDPGQTADGDHHPT